MDWLICWFCHAEMVNKNTEKWHMDFQNKDLIGWTDNISRRPRCTIRVYRMAMLARHPITGILQYDCFIGYRIFPISPTQCWGNLRKFCLCRIKIKIFDKIWSENVLPTIRKRKVTIRSEELQIIIWCSVPMHLSMIFQ